MRTASSQFNSPDRCAAMITRFIRAAEDGYSVLHIPFFPVRFHVQVNAGPFPRNTHLQHFLDGSVQPGKVIVAQGVGRAGGR